MSAHALLFGADLGITSYKSAEFEKVVEVVSTHHVFLSRAGSSVGRDPLVYFRDPLHGLIKQKHEIENVRLL